MRFLLPFVPFFFRWIIWVFNGHIILHYTGLSYFLFFFNFFSTPCDWQGSYLDIRWSYHSAPHWYICVLFFCGSGYMLCITLILVFGQGVYMLYGVCICVIWRVYVMFGWWHVNLRYPLTKPMFYGMYVYYIRLMACNVLYLWKGVMYILRVALTLVFGWHHTHTKHMPALNISFKN